MNQQRKKNVVNEDGNAVHVFHFYLVLVFNALFIHLTRDIHISARIGSYVERAPTVNRLLADSLNHSATSQKKAISY